jgi:hypothetical protein
MRPRINNFGKITRKELDAYLLENKIYGFTVKIKENTFIYSYNIMFRKNKERPEILFVEVSQNSKLVLKAWTDKDRKFNNVNELKKYVKI